MTIADSLLAEFEQEAQTTRKFLERLPNDKLAWKPHPKSMSAGELALHIALVPAGVLQGAKEDSFQAPDFTRPNPVPASTAEVLKALDQTVATVKAILPTITDDRMQATLRIKQGDKEILAMPRMVFLRNIMLNHWYHHRGQFGVYLRLLGASVPVSYGPSGDELPDFLR